MRLAPHPIGSGTALLAGLAASSAAQSAELQLSFTEAARLLTAAGQSLSVGLTTGGEGARPRLVPNGSRLLVSVPSPRIGILGGVYAIDLPDAKIAISARANTNAITVDLVVRPDPVSPESRLTCLSGICPPGQIVPRVGWQGATLKLSIESDGSGLRLTALTLDGGPRFSCRAADPFDAALCHFLTPLAEVSLASARSRLLTHIGETWAALTSPEGRSLEIGPVRVEGIVSDHGGLRISFRTVQE